MPPGRSPSAAGRSSSPPDRRSGVTARISRAGSKASPRCVAYSSSPAILRDPKRSDPRHGAAPARIPAGLEPAAVGVAANGMDATEEDVALGPPRDLVAASLEAVERCRVDSGLRVDDALLEVHARGVHGRLGAETA